MAKGVNGQVYIVGDKVVIARKGLLANPTFDRGDTEIPIRSITSVELKEPSLWTGGGFIEILYAGCPAPLPPQQRAKDPNVVLFTKSSLPDFLEIKDEIDRLRWELTESHQPVYENYSPASDIPKQIEDLARLYKAGILTEDEFTSKKKELLSRL